MSRVVVTGMGCVTPIGIGVAAFGDALRRGVSGVRRLSLCDPSPFNCQVAAEVAEFDPQSFMDAREARALPRVAQFSLAASRLALDHAGLMSWGDSGRVGLIVGTSSGPIAYALEQHSIYLERGMRRVHPSMPVYAHNSIVAAECAIQLGIHGPSMAVSSACTSSADAIGLGLVMIQGGVIDVAVVGGADAPICPAVIGSFDRLGMLPRGYNEHPSQAARPFDVARDGLVLGEGAGILVLESEAHATRRGAPVLAVMAGYGATCDASSHFKQEESGREAERAIRIALQGAAVDPGAVGYVNAHGTGTRENDPFEASVLATVFGGSPVLISSSKSQFGHLLGACGAVEAIATVVGMNCGFAPPTLNLNSIDPACAGLSLVGMTAREQSFDVAVSVSFGFGSRNAALVVQKVG